MLRSYMWWLVVLSLLVDAYAMARWMWHSVELQEAKVARAELEQATVACWNQRKLDQREASLDRLTDLQLSTKLTERAAARKAEVANDRREDSRFTGAQVQGDGATGYFTPLPMVTQPTSYSIRCQVGEAM